MSQLAGLEPNIRNAVRAVIVSDNRVLMQKKWSEPRGYWYTLPGGGQDVHETLEQALIRECQEEIGVAVRLERLLHVADFYKQRETTFPSSRHLVEFLFLCSVDSSYQPVNGHHPDKHQVDVVWMPFNQLRDHLLFPKGMANYLENIQSADMPVYLGTVA